MNILNNLIVPKGVDSGCVVKHADGVQSRFVSAYDIVNDSMEMRLDILIPEKTQLFARFKSEMTKEYLIGELESLLQGLKNDN